MIHYAWYGCDGEGNIRLAARASADGAVSVFLSDGRVMSATAATATNDGHVYFEFRTAEDITCTITHDGIDYEHSIRIRPLKSSGARIVVWSCGADIKKMAHSFEVMNSFSPDAVVCLGDFIYADASAGTLYGETRVNVRNYVIRTTGPDAYRPHYRTVMRSPEWKRLAASCPQYMTWHDHEIFDGWAHDCVTNLNKFFHPASNGYDVANPGVEQIPNSFTDAEKVAASQAIYDAAHQAFMERFGATNPPSGYEAQDIRWRLRIPGLAELICPDHLTYFSGSQGDLQGLSPTYYTNPPAYIYLGSAGNASRIIHGTSQQAWVLSALAAAESDGVPHKVLLLGTQSHEHNNDALNNSDTLARCTTERDAIVAAFSELTGAVAISGDSHQCAMYQDADYRCYMSGSVSSGTHQQGTGYKAGVHYKRWGNSGQPAADLRDSWAFHVVDLLPTEQINTVVDAHTGATIIGPHRIAAGEKATVDRRVRIG